MTRRRPATTLRMPVSNLSDRGTGEFIPALQRWSAAASIYQVPLFLLAFDLERAGVTAGQRREQILEVADFRAGTDVAAGGFSRVQDDRRQLAAVAGVDLVRTRIVVHET